MYCMCAVSQCNKKWPKETTEVLETESDYKKYTVDHLLFI